MSDLQSGGEREPGRDIPYGGEERYEGHMPPEGREAGASPGYPVAGTGAAAGSDAALRTDRDRGGTPGETADEAPPRESGMREAAFRSVRHHTASVPEAEWPHPSVFPSPLVLTTWIAAAAGAIIGAVFGYLMLRNVIVIPGWEQLYSMTPFTFVVFWIFAGTALGIFVSAAIIALSPPGAERRKRASRHRGSD